MKAYQPHSRLFDVLTAVVFAIILATFFAAAHSALQTPPGNGHQLATAHGVQPVKRGDVAAGEIGRLSSGKELQAKGSV